MEDINVVLLTIDSLRADFIGVYNDEQINLTPNLNKFAQDSVVFKNAIAQGTYTRTSIPSMLTSTYPSKFSGNRLGYVNERLTLTEIVKKEGYNTAFIHSNPFLSKTFGYHKGFDVFDDSLLPWNPNLPEETLRLIGRILRLVRRTPYLPANKITKKSISWLNKASIPFFLWVHYMDPHGPYQSKKGWSYLNKLKAERIWRKAVKHPEMITKSERKQIIQAYKEEISLVDENIGRLLEKIEQTKGSSITIITADHGEQFGEHGQFSHGSDPYEELIHVPLLIKLPWVENGKKIQNPVALIDVVPTILDTVRLDWEKFGCDGTSLLPLINFEEPNFREYVISEPAPNKISLRTQNWKYIADNKDRELYNLKEDPREQSNLVSKESALAKEFESQLQEHISSSGNKYQELKVSELEVEEELKKRLEDLGYL